MALTYLVTEIIGLTASTISAIANGYIVSLFARKRVHSPENLRLALYLSIGDLGYALSAFVHLAYLIFYWNYVYFNYNPYAIIISNSILQSHLKIIMAVSLSMAVDRILAIYRPVYYRRASRIQYANIVLTIGIVWFLFDLIFQLITSQYKEKPNCATMSCFVDKKFLYYTSYSNSVAGVLIIVMSTVVFVGLRGMKSQKETNSASLKSSSVFQQANRICVGILFSSLFFVTIPSLLVSLYETFTGVSLFVYLGPFYVAAILLNGIADSFVLLFFNRKLIIHRMQNHSHHSHNNTKIASSHPPVDTHIMINIM